MTHRTWKAWVAKVGFAICLGLQGVCFAEEAKPTQTEASAQEAWSALHQQATELWKQGRYDEGLVLAKQALELAEASWNAEHLNVATSLNKLGNLLADKGDYAQACVRRWGEALSRSQSLLESER
jgi:tetratricopeptide (TPR) repeat protein